MGYPGGGGVTIPEAAQGMTGLESQCHAVVDEVQLKDVGGLFNINYAIIPCYEKVAPANFYLLSPF